MVLDYACSTNVMEESMKIKMSDAELIIMNILWGNYPIKAIEIAGELADDWNKNTTYTLIKRLIEKGAISREEPHFVCTPLVNKDEIMVDETKSLVNKLFGGSFNNLVMNFVKSENLTKEEINELENIIKEAKNE